MTEFGYGVNNWWHTELELETGRDPGPGNHLKFDQITWENIFQFTERGQYWVDSGFFWEYGHGMLNGTPDETTFGPIFRKQIGHDHQYGQPVLREGHRQFCFGPARIQLCGREPPRARHVYRARYSGLRDARSDRPFRASRRAGSPYRPAAFC